MENYFEKKENKINDLHSFNNKVSKSNQNLIHVKCSNKIHSLFLEQEVKRNKDKKLSIRISKIEDDDSNNNEFSSKINNNQSDTENNNKNTFKTKILRTVGKKINNFPQIFEEKNNLLNKLFQKFISKISGIHNKFNS